MLPVLIGITLALFVYYCSTGVVYKEEPKTTRDDGIENKNEHTKKVVYDSLGNPVRFCPICRRQLEPGEKILGTLSTGEAKGQLLIKGCRACNALPAAGSASASC